MPIPKIDTHTHCVPQFWVEEVKKAGKGPILVRNSACGSRQRSLAEQILLSRMMKMSTWK
jgi:hypothetical protein